MVLHNERHLTQQFTCMHTNHVSSYNLFLLACQHQLDKACRLAFGLRTVYSSNGKFHYPCVLVLFLGLIRCQSDMGYLWISKGTPGYNPVIDFLFAYGDECIAYCDSRLICRYVRKKVVTDDIPNSENIWC